MSSLFGHIWKSAKLPDTAGMEGHDHWLHSKCNTVISGQSLTLGKSPGMAAVYPLPSEGTILPCDKLPCPGPRAAVQRLFCLCAITKGKAKEGSRATAPSTPTPLSCLGPGLASTCSISSVSHLKTLSSLVYSGWSGYHCDSLKQKYMGLYMCA